jgi:predicted peroxiredoxin
MSDVVAMIADSMNLEVRVFLTYTTLIFGKRVQIKKSKKKVTDFFVIPGIAVIFESTMSI